MGTGLLIRKTEKLKLERALMASQCTFFIQIIKLRPTEIK